MKIVPTRDLILIEADKPKEQTKSGIFIVEDWKTLPPMGVVQAVGPDADQTLLGKRVIFERYGAVTVEDDMKLCLESHIQAVVEDDDATE